MCSAPATSKEHVPPKGFFPQQKDMPGVDYRKNLITVPSCDLHNMEKSHDDEYLACAIVCDLENNQVAQNHFSTKILRALKRKPYFSKTILSNQRPVFVNGQESIAFEIDKNRLNSGMEKIARALYYHTYKEQWTKPIRVYCLSLRRVNGTSFEKNPLAGQMAQASSVFFSGRPTCGENPDVFYYQIEHIPEKEYLLIKLVFYGGFEVLCMSAPKLEKVANQKRTTGVSP